MYCTKCGGEIPEGAMFCTYCGQPVQGQKMQPAMRSVNNGYVAKKPKIRIPAVPQDPAEAELPPAAAQEPPAHIRVPRTVREAQSTIPQSAPRSLHMRNSSLAIRMYTVGQA